MKKASLKSRLFAYLVDSIIVLLIMFLISKLISNEEITELNKNLNSIIELFIDKKINFSIYFSEISIIYQKLDVASALINVINALIIFIYFVVIPYFFDGKTIGKFIFKIKTIRNDKELLTFKNLILKNIIDTGLINMLISLILMYILSPKSYFISTQILVLIQIILLIISFNMIRKRKDKRGLNDIISGTKVIEDIEVKE